MDVSDYLKSGLQSFHKTQGAVFGKRLDIDTRSKKLKEDRKVARDKLMSKKRLIKDNASPYKTPIAVNIKKKDLKQNKQVQNRFEKLKQWKEQKMRKIAEEKAKAKPIFKVTHVSIEIGGPKLENVNKVIKGKPIKSQQKTKTRPPLLPKYEFAPQNYQFKGPTSITTENIPKAENKQKRKLIRQANVLEETINTPKSKNAAVTYISPFVTISRGKDSARKEFHYRKSKGGLFDSSPDIENSTGPKAGAAYFHKLLDGEISRIQGLCDEWNLYKEEQQPPEEACDMINVAIGQSQLLLEKKFKQFRNLIDSCDSGLSEMPITCEDLHGYWDTAYIQVENLNQRFDNLVKLRANNWEEIVPDKKNIVVKKAGRIKRKVQASSRLKDAIRAAKNKAKVSSETKKDDVGIINTVDIDLLPTQSTLSPDIKYQTRSWVKKRKSQLAEVTCNDSLKYETSPALIMWKTSQAAKSIEKEAINTPGRSILKARRSRSSVKINPKSVIFRDEEVCEVPVGKLISLTPEISTTRMSLRKRRTRTILF